MKASKIIVSFIIAVSFSLATTGSNFAQGAQGVQGAQSAYSRQAQPAVKKIEWGTNLYAAYKQSVEEKKPLVVFFYVYSGNFSTQFAKNVLYTERMNAYAGRAVFARVDVEIDDQYKNAAKMISSLKLTEYPVVAVLDSWPDKIVERGHVTGFHEPQTFYTLFDDLLMKRPAGAISKR